MKTLSTIEKLKEFRSSLGSKTLAFVPTMGALHEGHLSLVHKAKELADIVIVSIFVNPLQFGPNEDYTKYPRLLKEDSEKLSSINVDYLFCPDLRSVEEAKHKPHPEKEQIKNQKEQWFTLLHEYKDKVKANLDIANKLCGLNRPGHFDGVCAVVKLFFDLIKPDFAIFGEKDYQQLMVIKDLVESNNIETKIVAHPIIREANGLAMSSRNQYLSKEQKELAPNLHKELQNIKNETSKLEDSKNKLELLGFRVDYLETHWDRIFVAAKLGNTRLIDNLSLVDH